MSIEEFTPKFEAELLKQRALDLYKPPFRYTTVSHRYGYEVLDDDGMSMCLVGNNCKDRGELIASALNEYWEKHK